MVDDKATTINALIEAVEAIEMELGITPSGVYSDVRVRMDILEARINNPLAPAPNVENPFIIGNDGVTISTGSLAPTENRLSGSLYLRTDGYSNEGLYARRPDGYWHQIDTDPWTAAGDLSGNIYSQTVIGLQNRPMSSDTPTDTLAGDGYVVSWNSGLSQWEPQVGFYAAGDLDGYKDNQTVVNIQGYTVLMGTLNSTTDGYSLIWNNGSTQWEPQRLAAVFSPLNDSAATNIRSNRYLKQSPVNDGYVGIVNFSSDSVLITVGSAANYATIVGGDQNTVTGDYGFIGGGLSNTVAAPISVIVGGRFNDIMSGGGLELSFIGGGNNNAISGDRSVIVGGDTNVIAGSQSAILTGVGNVVNGAHSVILLGDTNVIDAVDSFIGAGSNNQITAGQYGTILTGNGNTVSGNYSTVLSGLTNAVVADHGFISAGFNNIVNGNQSSVLNGNHNTIATGHSYTTILNGDHNSITGDNNTLLNGSLNTITASGVVTLGGSSNTITSNKVSIFGDNNTVTGIADYAAVWGDHNTVNTESKYLANWGSNNTINDGYVSIFGDHNLVGSSTYASIHGNQNTIGNSDGYSAIFGTQNTIANGSTNVHISGSSNTVNGASSGSSVWGNNNNVTGNFSNVWGDHNTTTADRSAVFGSYGKSVYPGQFSIAAQAAQGGTTAGSSQYSKIILDGYQVSGGQFDLKIPGSGNNIVLEDGKSYDITVRVLINSTSGADLRARHVFDVLAHCEAGVLTLDATDHTINTPILTGWTVSLLVSGNQLVVRVDSVGTQDRRALATVDWRELSRL